MRYVFECDNMHPGCEDRIEGETKEEVIAAVADHERASHGAEEPTPKAYIKIEALIRPQ